MGNQHWTITTGLGVMLAIAPRLLPPAAPAVQFPDGTVAFTSPPRLADFRTSRDLAGARNVTYYFTITLPEEAEESLSTLDITLIEGSPQGLRYRLEETAAFQGTYSDRGEGIPVATATYDRDEQRFSLTLAEPAAPGQDITVALRPVHNPLWEGVYLFELEASPVGDLVRSQRVGTARMHIYSRDRPFPLF